MWVKNLYIFIVRRCSTMAESINHIQWFELSGLEEAREDQEGLTGMSGGWMDGWRKESREGRGRKAVLFYLGRLWVVAPSLKYTRLTPTLSSRLRGRDGATPPAEDIQRENKLSAAQTGSDGRLTREGGEAGGCHSVNTTQSTEAMMCSLWGGKSDWVLACWAFSLLPAGEGVVFEPADRERQWDQTENVLENLVLSWKHYPNSPKLHNTVWYFLNRERVRCLFWETSHFFFCVFTSALD